MLKKFIKKLLRVFCALKRPNQGFTPLEKAIDFNQWLLPIKVYAGLPRKRPKVLRGLKPPSTQAARPVRKFFSNGVKELYSLTGFSLIELLVVLGIIGIFTFLGLPYFRSFIGYSSLKKDAWTLLSTLRAYRQQAIIEHYNYRFVFDTGADTYTIEQRDATTDAFIQTVSTVNFTNDLTAATNTTFQPKGNANPSSTIILKEKSSSDTINIEVFSTTGLSKITSS